MRHNFDYDNWLDAPLYKKEREEERNIKISEHADENGLTFEEAKKELEEV